LSVLIDPKRAVFLSVVVGWAATLYFGRRVARVPVAQLVVGTLVITATALAGARLHYLLGSSTAAGVTGRLADSGVHAGGGVIGLVLGLLLVVRLLGLSPAVLADVSAMAAGVALAVYRLGCFARGCCFGTPSDLPWAIRYDRHSAAFLLHVQARLVDANDQWSAPVHPLPLYFAAAALAITTIGAALHRLRRFDGEIALVGLTLFSLSTLGLEFLRASVPGQVRWGPLPQLVWIAAGLSLASVVTLAMTERAARRAVEYGRRSPRH